MDAPRFDDKRNELKRMIRRKEREIEQEYLRFGIITTQKAEEINQKIDTLTDELITLKQTLAEMEAEDSKTT